jgi:hypothetical protein
LAACARVSAMASHTLVNVSALAFVAALVIVFPSSTR